MSEPASDQSAEPARQFDRQLMAESSLYGVPYKAYADMSPRERGAVKGRWAHRLRQEAKRRRVDPDDFQAMSEDAREEVRKENPEHSPLVIRREREAAAASAAARAFEQVARKHIENDEPEAAPPEPEPERRPRPQVAPLYDEGLIEGDEEDHLGDGHVHSSMDEVPATEGDPKMRAHPTLGDVRPTDNEDLAGWKQPRNLLDVYARYSVGDGQHFVRVERVDPKVWQGIPTAGFLGSIREPITEDDFALWFGGRVYTLTVYGPDPKGRRDPATGLPVIKAKTDPFRYTVPRWPPNLTRLPGTNPTKQQGESQMNPFAPGFQGHIPATPADAAMHKTNIDFMSNLLKTSEEEKRELRRVAEHSASGPSRDVLGIVSDASQRAIEQANKASEAREKAMQEQLAQAREDNKSLAAKMDKLTEQQQAIPRTTPMQEAANFLKEVQPGKSAEEEVIRLRQAHTEETARIRDGHREAVAALRERQDDELKRLRERLDDVEKHGRDKVDELDRRLRERETELRAQMDQIRRDEREAAVTRVQETVARFEDRIKDIKDQHTRELRMQGEQHATRVDVTKSTWEMQLSTAKERAAKLEEDLEDAREEAEKAKDPVAVMKKGSELAEALGFKKPDETDNQTAGERFVGTVGMGLSKAFETMNEWLPKAMEARRPLGQLPPGSPGAPGALPPGQGGQQQQRVVRQPTRRAVSWASQGSIPIANQQPIIPPDPVIQQQPQAQPFQPPMAPPVVAQPMAQPQPPQHVPQQQAPIQQQPEPPQTNGHAQATNGLGAIFSDANIAEFRTEVERAINVGLPPATFAERFIGMALEPSAALVQMYKPEDFVNVVKAMPSGAESVILRRDGKKWVEKLWQQIAAQHQARAAQAAPMS